MASSTPARLTLVVACAIAFAAAPASAATLHGTVVGQPKTAHGRVVVPVLLSASGARAAGGPLARVSVPSRNGLRTNVGAIKGADLRIGDRVHATVSRIAKSGRAAVLRIGARGAAPPFARLTASRASATARVQQAAGDVDRLKADPMSLLNPATPATSTEALRGQLEDVRKQLNTTVSDLRATADGIDKAVATIERDRPAEAHRRAAVARQQKSLLAGLTASATASRTAAGQLEAAVTKLDETINDLGGASTPSIGLNEVGTVSDVLHAVLELLRGP